MLVALEWFVIFMAEGPKKTRLIQFLRFAKRVTGGRK